MARRPATIPVDTTLADLGYKSGATMDQPDGYASFHFQIPHDVKVAGGELRLHYFPSPLLGSYSNMRVYVNGSPRWATSLYHQETDSWLTVPLTRADLRERYLSLVVKSSLVISADRCFDQRIAGGFLQVLPDSVLDLRVRDPELASIRGFWDTLGHKVVVSLPEGGLPPSGIAAAWQVSHTLRRSGHEVAFATLPQVGDIVIAPPATAEASSKDAAFGPATGSTDVMLDTHTRRPVLVVRPPYASALLTDPWLLLAASDRIDGGTRSVQVGEPQKSYVALLSSLGFQDGLHETSSSTDWSVRVRADQLPPRYRLASVRLDLLSAPGEAGHPVDFYVYLNGTLIRAAQLNDSGRQQSIDITLPDYLVQGDNTLRFVASRNDPNGNCRGGMPSFPIQIMPDSLVTARPDTHVAAAFSDLPSYFAGPFSVYLPAKALAEPAQSLLLLSGLSADLGFDPQNAQLRAATDSPDPHEPFIWLENRTPAGFDPSVRFDRGEIEVVTGRGRELLRTGRLPGIAIAQVLASNQRTGLWIRSADSRLPLPAPQSLFLKDGDVAFFDDREILLDLDSRHTDLARIAYPDYLDWFALIGAYRYWIFAALWVLMTVGAVRLFRRLRRAS